MDLENKRIAVIGTGASGIQVIQECSKRAKQLTSYQRTPNLCLPMCQEDLPADTDEKRKTDGLYDQAFAGCLDTFAGESAVRGEGACASCVAFPGQAYGTSLR